MRKDLLKRLHQIEASFPSAPKWPNIVIVSPRIDPERKKSLAKGERIVQDWYLCLGPETGYFWARERITSDPNDGGRVCKPDQCLKDVLQEVGGECGQQADGSCENCAQGEYPKWYKWPKGFRLG